MGEGRGRKRKKEEKNLQKKPTGVFKHSRRLAHSGSCYPVCGPQTIGDNYGVIIILFLFRF